MAFLAPLAGELVLDAEAGVGAGNIVQGAETIATTFAFLMMALVLKGG